MVNICVAEALEKCTVWGGNIGETSLNQLYCVDNN